MISLITHVSTLLRRGVKWFNFVHRHCWANSVPQFYLLDKNASDKNSVRLPVCLTAFGHPVRAMRNDQIMPTKKRAILSRLTLMITFQTPWNFKIPGWKVAFYKGTAVCIKLKSHENWNIFSLFNISQKERANDPLRKKLLFGILLKRAIGYQPCEFRFPTKNLKFEALFIYLFL